MIILIMNSTAYYFVFFIVGFVKFLDTMRNAVTDASHACFSQN